MKKNMSMVDRLLRMIIAVLLLILNLTGMATGGLAIAFWVILVILALTAVVGFCPLYAIFKYSTLKTK
ncbi:MAG: DUF2892 domain-containing protein [Chloroflexi bacterium]|nr:DUF2892 domain-containing protein [Chloroflexota bacterium]